MVAIPAAIETTTVATVETAAPAPETTAKVEKKAPRVRKATAKEEKKAPAPAPVAKKAKGEKKSIWSPKRIAVMKALRSLKATAAHSGKSADEVAKKSGLTVADVKHYLYKNQKIAKAGYIKTALLEGARDFVYYLTASGAKVDLA